MPAADHAVGDDRGEQRLDGAEERDGNCRADETHEHCFVDRWKRGPGKREIECAEPGADGLDRQMRELHHQCRGDQDHERGRYPHNESGPGQEQHE